MNQTAANRAADVSARLGDKPAPMADERETAQWYIVNGHTEEVKNVLTRTTGSAHRGQMWNQLPIATKDALRRELYRIQTQATAPHQFEEIPGDRPILKDKCNQCGADRNAPIHNPAQPDAMERLDAADLSVHSVESTRPSSVFDIMRQEDARERAQADLDEATAAVANAAEELISMFEQIGIPCTVTEDDIKDLRDAMNARRGKLQAITKL